MPAVRVNSTSLVPGPVSILKGVGPAKAKQLENLNIFTLRDLICHFPRGYEDRTQLKTNLKKFDAALVSGDKAAAEAAYKVAVKSVDQAVLKGLLHKNNAARKKSSMTLKLNKLA